ncbi:hypothetical protein [Sphingobium yanoikuyae]|uniref:hypothetical protein n=1 Tax=Sphingobium yanoikuyae TaxID=13690 RepID=UPI0028B15E63|nr:hypothetical protein [Sphingobium yanoikuyae]
MPIIRTERNYVHAHAIGDDDVFVRASFFGYDEAGNRVLHHMPYRGIEEYQAEVDWAVSMADRMAHPLYVVPFSYDDMLVSGRFDPLCKAARMTDQERGQMRRGIIKSMIEVLRDCDDWRVRADAYDILVQLKVTYES